MMQEQKSNTVGIYSSFAKEIILPWRIQISDIIIFGTGRQFSGM